MDGAGTFSRFWHVTVPMIRPAIATRDAHALRGCGLRPGVASRRRPNGATETLATQVYKQTFALGNFGFGAALA